MWGKETDSSDHLASKGPGRIRRRCSWTAEDDSASGSRMKGSGIPSVRDSDSGRPTALAVRGTLRGIRYASVPPDQAKYVTCVNGAVLDVVVDIRTGSPSRTTPRWATCTRRDAAA